MGCTTKAKRVQSSTSKFKVLIVDDHPIIRFGFKSVIEREKGLKICGQAEDVSEALQILDETKPDIVIVDISLKNSNGFDLIKEIKRQKPQLPVLVVSMHEENIYAERALQAGASGYVMKQVAMKTLIEAIYTILDGRIYTSNEVASRMVNKMVGDRVSRDNGIVNRLSDREFEVFNLIGQGLGTRQIADKLFLSVKTIETYRAHIKQKLGLMDSSELLHYAIQWVLSENSTTLV